MHFADKDALMLEVCVRHFHGFVSTLAAAGTDSDDPLDLLRARGRAYVEYGLENPEPYRILFMQQSDSFANRSVASTAADSFALLAAAVEECLDQGIFPEGDPFTISCTLWASIHGLTSLMISNPDFPWPPLDDLLDVGTWVFSGPRGQ
ncbi:MAG: WHG domain-containing protein [Acidimicrobiia bacterium]|nr:WHG domain-containing protein [Acidimicrobiia bacterium]